MHKHNLARLAVLGHIIVIKPEALRAMPGKAPAKPDTLDTTAADLARIEAAARRRKMKQAKRMKGGA